MTSNAYFRGVDSVPLHDLRIAEHECDSAKIFAIWNPSPRNNTCRLVWRAVYFTEVCFAHCQNAGRCVAGNKCVCPTFFVGSRCQKFSLETLLGTPKKFSSPDNGPRDVTRTMQVSDVRMALDKALRILQENKANNGVKSDMLFGNGNNMNPAQEAAWGPGDDVADQKRLLIGEPWMF